MIRGMWVILIVARPLIFKCISVSIGAIEGRALKPFKRSEAERTSFKDWGKDNLYGACACLVVKISRLNLTI